MPSKGERVMAAMRHCTNFLRSQLFLGLILATVPAMGVASAGPHRAVAHQAQDLCVSYPQATSAHHQRSMLV